MAKSYQLKTVAFAYLALFWCTFVYAAENPLVAGLESIPPKALLYVLGLSIVGGAAGTLSKLTRPDIVVRNLGLEIAKDVFMSVLAGALMFFFTSWVPSVSFWPQAILITMSGYGGSKVIDMIFTDGAFPAMRTLVQRVFNITPKDPTGGAQP